MVYWTSCENLPRIAPSFTVPAWSNLGGFSSLVRLNGLPISAFTHSMYHDVTKLSVWQEVYREAGNRFSRNKIHDLNRLITDERPLITSRFRELYDILTSFFEIEEEVSLSYTNPFIAFSSLSYVFVAKKICLREREQVFVRRWKKSSSNLTPLVCRSRTRENNVSLLRRICS